MFAPKKVRAAAHVVGDSFPRIEFKRLFRTLHCTFNSGRRVIGESQCEILQMCKRESGESQCKIRINFGCPLKQSFGLGIVVLLIAPQMPKSALAIFPGIQTFRRFAPGAFLFCQTQLWRNGTDHGLGNIVLDGEDIF